MVRRYRELEVPVRIRERISLISENDHKHVHLKHSSTPYELSGYIHRDTNNNAHGFFLVDLSEGGERLKLTYEGLESMRVEVFTDGSARNSLFASTCKA